MVKYTRFPFFALGISFGAAFVISSCETQPDNVAPADISGQWQFEVHVVQEEGTSSLERRADPNVHDIGPGTNFYAFSMPSKKGWTIKPLCIFQQTGELITGTCEARYRTGAASGSVRGNVVQFTWDVLTEGTKSNRNEPVERERSNSSALHFSGALDSNTTMKGSLFSSYRIDLNPKAPDAAGHAAPEGRFTGKKVSNSNAQIPEAPDSDAPIKGSPSSDTSVVKELSNSDAQLPGALDSNVATQANLPGDTSTGKEPSKSGDISGDWKFDYYSTVHSHRHLSSSLCSLQQAGERVTGTCEGPGGDVPVTGVVNGKKIELYANMPGNSWREFATLDSDITMKGTLADGRQSFTADKLFDPHAVIKKMKVPNLNAGAKEISCVIVMQYSPDTSQEQQDKGIPSNNDLIRSAKARVESYAENSAELGEVNASTTMSYVLHTFSNSHRKCCTHVDIIGRASADGAVEVPYDLPNQDELTEQEKTAYGRFLGGRVAKTKWGRNRLEELLRGVNETVCNAEEAGTMKIFQVLY